MSEAAEAVADALEPINYLVHRFSGVIAHPCRVLGKDLVELTHEMRTGSRKK